MHTHTHTHARTHTHTHKCKAYTCMFHSLCSSNLNCSLEQSQHRIVQNRNQNGSEISTYPAKGQSEIHTLVDDGVHMTPHSLGQVTFQSVHEAPDLKGAEQARHNVYIQSSVHSHTRRCRDQGERYTLKVNEGRHGLQ